MTRCLQLGLFATCAMASLSVAEPFQEVTIGMPVTSMAEAEAWYLKLLGPDVKVMRPVPGIVEFQAAPGVWLQLFEAEASQEDHRPIVRFLVEDMAAAQNQRKAIGIETGTAVNVPGIVTYSEFADPDQNALSFYAMP